ncbi:ABC transporter substrate-binding protein [Kibdelosporangium aridum]|uniref:NitT/TauT family transport system substrate-binding protein n=1 Tax=Kibdelosporangium aridum TaxID=2030 RepID=A0A1W2FIZ1_KIBAR|nr:ABC transporter substrate-binding protein [Kibdelosporangium aridum]SMD21704.1 NitT/TauT family transport system substrate-binding protein [Kibdelosporangium aridum]
MALLISVVLAAACTASDSDHPAPEKASIKLGVLPVLGAAPVFLAAEKGFFAAEGLKVDFVTIQGAGAAVGSMTSGDLDLVFGNYVSFFAAQAKKTAEVRFVADGYSANPRTWMVLVAKDSQLRKPSDISGKRVAVTTVNSLAELTIRSVLTSTGQNITSPNFVEMSYTAMGEALKNRTVDAALLSEPYITDVSKRYGAVPLFDAAAGATADIPISGYATSEKFANENPNTIAAFQRALSRGVDVALTDRNEVEKSIRGYAGVDEQTAALTALVGFPIGLDPKRLQRVCDLMFSYGELTTRIEARPMILPGALSKSLLKQ